MPHVRQINSSACETKWKFHAVQYQAPNSMLVNTPRTNPISSHDDGGTVALAFSSSESRKLPLKRREKPSVIIGGETFVPASSFEGSLINVIRFLESFSGSLILMPRSRTALYWTAVRYFPSAMTLGLGWIADGMRVDLVEREVVPKGDHAQWWRRTRMRG